MFPMLSFPDFILTDGKRMTEARNDFTIVRHLSVENLPADDFGHIECDSVSVPCCSTVGVIFDNVGFHLCCSECVSDGCHSTRMPHGVKHLFAFFSRYARKPRRGRVMAFPP